MSGQPASPTPLPPPICSSGTTCVAGQTCQSCPSCPTPKTGLSAGDIAAIILGILFLISIAALILLFFKHPKCPSA